MARHLEARRAGSVSPEQEAEFQEWLQQDPDRQEQWAAAKTLWFDVPEAADASDDAPSPDLEAAWSDVAARLDLPSGSDGC
jgi:ferric-dicitrate binding protein FerR (iron transport regulator)